MADFTAQLLEVHGRNIGKDGMVFALPGLTQRGIFSQAIFYLFLCHEFLFFSAGFVTSPQLWGRLTAIVGRLHHSCGEGTPQLWGNNDKGDKNDFLA